MLNESIIGSGKPLIIIESSPIKTIQNCKFLYNANEKYLKIDNSTSTRSYIPDIGAIKDTYGLTHRRIVISSSSGLLYFGFIQPQGITVNTDKLYLDDFVSTANGGKRVTLDIPIAEAIYIVTIQDIVIKLPYTEELAESYTPKFRTWEMLNGNVDKELLGYKYKAELDYSQFTNKAFFDNTQGLFTAMQGVLGVSRRNMIFYPRSDNYSVSYRVDFADETEMRLAVIKGFRGHKYFSISLEGLDLLKEILVASTPDNFGYGDCYGGNNYLTYGYVL